ncbi:hypothetical protein H0B56_21065 [Haloechinothrix sp. YIM 98757]|uniref:Uncharacterized protein n=1 Tax=Haloechinothrix aidingensis TaxID=2752311 RepID=A0A838AFB0_9PSEU|nr:hypothetical protein [Haloechinothrix aidingensis]MBA0128044.1 hypothetical protein [Haloechinothrix aidingensis]
MNSESITKWLTAIGVPADVVSIGAEADGAWCLIRTEHAPATQETGVAQAEDAPREVWEVFWREQGNRYDWASFTNEQVASHYLFGRLAWAQVVRGAIGTPPASG